MERSAAGDAEPKILWADEAAADIAELGIVEDVFAVCDCDWGRVEGRALAAV